MPYYRGVECQQVENFREILHPFLRSVNPEIVVEIGTAAGGTTLFIADVLPNSRIVSFEIDPSKPNQQLQWYKNCNLYIGDIWQREKLKQCVRHYLSVPRSKLVLCDGGNKIQEFIHAAAHLRQGDVIGAHDYCVSKAEYEANYAGTIWHWLEITHDDIAEACSKYHLTPINHETHQAMWGFYRKVK
jgi:cephalosporin hydroxylase